MEDFKDVMSGYSINLVSLFSLTLLVGLGILRVAVYFLFSVDSPNRSIIPFTFPIDLVLSSY